MEKKGEIRDLMAEEERKDENYSEMSSSSNWTDGDVMNSWGTVGENRLRFADMLFRMY